VKKLAKPSVPVWTANQLARREPGEVRALLRSAEELRKAQARALAGKGAKDLQERLTEQRRAVRALARLGREMLAAEGRSVSDAIVERIAQTLDAAALDEGSRFLLRAGRLTEELEPPGFEALAGMAVAPPKKRQARAGGKRGDVTAARRGLQEAQREARARAREALEAEREVERAETAAADARRAAQKARERSDEADQEVARAEAALREAQRG
jgi:hypothetical protein